MKIRKNLFLSISVLLVASLAFSACSKDSDDKEETKDYPVEKPLSDFLSLSGLGQKSEVVETTTMGRWGVKFKPNVKGVIKAITIRIPATHIYTISSVPIRLSQTGGTTHNFEITDVNVNVEKRFELSTPIAVSAGSNYTLSFESENYFDHSRNDGNVPDYPITVGNIDFTGTVLQTLGSGVNPIISAGIHYYGDLGFEFQKTD